VCDERRLGGAAVKCGDDRRQYLGIDCGRAPRSPSVRLCYRNGPFVSSGQPGQHKGPITRTFLDVLQALLWGFHNSRTGCCFPSYEAIAAKAECARSTVAEAVKVLEWAGVLTWQHRITRVLVRELDLFGRRISRWRVLRTSNAYVFRDRLASESENRIGTLNQGFKPTSRVPGRVAKAGIEQVELVAPEVRHAAEQALAAIRMRRMAALGLG
jgi:hypothetical protein